MPYTFQNKNLHMKDNGKIKPHMEKAKYSLIMDLIMKDTLIKEKVIVKMR